MSNEMKDYIVKIPFAGYLCTTVRAGSKKEAYEMGWKEIDDSGMDMVTSNVTNVFCDEWDMHKHLSNGNCDHTGCNSYVVEEQ